MFEALAELAAESMEADALTEVAETGEGVAGFSEIEDVLDEANENIVEGINVSETEMMNLNEQNTELLNTENSEITGFEELSDSFEQESTIDLANDDVLSGESDMPDKSKELPRCPPENCEYGYYDGERGNSDFYPNSEYVPAEKIGNTKSNPDGLNMKEIFDKHGIEKIPFKDGYPDFSEVSKATVEIDDFGPDRYGPNGNFTQAIKKIAEERGCTQREVKDWMHDEKNNYTLHECADCKTIQKVPNEIHANIRHDGGVHIAKQEAE